MKALIHLFIPVMAIALSLSGCGKAEQKTSPTPPEKGTVQTAVEGFTGKTYIDAGLRAKEQFKKASEKETRELNEVME